MRPSYHMIRDVAPLPGYPEPTGLLCAILLDATTEWRGELDGDLGPEATTWRARPGGPSMGAILLHMIIVEVFWLEQFVMDLETTAEDKQLLMWNEIDVDAPHWPDAPAQPLSWYFALHDRYRARILEVIKQWPKLDSLKDRPGEDGKYSLRWVLGHVIQHEAYHGGQIVMLNDLWKNAKGSASSKA